eukprot:5164165-Amphidinium_carterae.1
MCKSPQDVPRACFRYLVHAGAAICSEAASTAGSESASSTAKEAVSPQLHKKEGTRKTAMLSKCERLED